MMMLLKEDGDGNKSLGRKCEQRVFQIYSKFLIDTRNKKLKFFHLIVSSTLFFDFAMTGFLLGNYKFMSGQDVHFFDHEKKYFYICFI